MMLTFCQRLSGAELPGRAVSRLSWLAVQAPLPPQHCACRRKRSTSRRTRDVPWVMRPKQIHTLISKSLGATHRSSQICYAGEWQ
ncbi:unnamed protein product [Symbiodinium sp. CCMP2592]|nr:unnamed protein product [Symbiodinium sp. CCMP2592]